MCFRIHLPSASKSARLFAGGFCCCRPARTKYAGRVERGEQNISVQSLIQIALTLRVELGELFPPLRELKAPYRKKLEP